jgi:uncharacterized repeat protein (TIGR03803 family)
MMNSRMTTVVIVLCFVVAGLAVRPARAQKFEVLHAFKGAPNDGRAPVGVLVRDSAGNIYGTTASGGSGKGQCIGNGGGCGTAFKMNNAGKLVWIHSFMWPNGFEPLAGLLRDKSGSLYGTASLGGNSECSLGCGVVFKLDKDGNETVLHKFSKGSDGSSPEALLVGDAMGNLYGTTYMGGTFGYGTVFKVDTTGKEIILHSFAGPPTGGADGAYSLSGVIRDTAGSLYGVTGSGGAGEGTVYELNKTGDETLLYSFGGADGAGPRSVLVADASGNLYGTTEGGGNGGCFDGGGCGTVFELSPHSDGNWTERVLYVFCSLSNCADGEYPDAGPLVLDAAGNLYGTTIWGGAYQNCNGITCGVVFKLDTTGKETVLHSFTGGKDGAFPWPGLTMDAAGNLYGVAEEGGDANCYAPYGCGVVFKITP